VLKPPPLDDRPERWLESIERSPDSKTTKVEKSKELLPDQNGQTRISDWKEQQNRGSRDRGDFNAAVYLPNGG
jgi:hypothetical protein